MSGGSVELDHLSLATTPVVALHGEQPLWQGSGFLYLFQRGEDQFLYLVTNLHVLTGHPPGAKGRSAADHIAFHLRRSAEVSAEVRPVRVPLFTRQGRPVWLESASVPHADVAAIPVPASVCSGCSINCIDASWASAGNSEPGPLTPVHAVAFPYGYHDRENGLPLWQSGMLASEPAVDFGGDPCMAVELAAYPGTSGAPVFMLTQHQPPGAATQVASPVVMRRFLGVYASPALEQGGGYPEAYCAQASPAAIARDAGGIGRIWRASVVEDLVSSVDTAKWEREILADLP